MSNSNTCNICEKTVIKLTSGLCFNCAENHSDNMIRTNAIGDLLRMSPEEFTETTGIDVL